MTTQEVADLLGVSVKAVYIAVYRGALRKARTGRGGATFDRADVETYLARRWRPDQPDPDPYWIDLTETAQLLSTSPQWTRVLAHRGRLPTPIRHPTGRLLFRRQQIQGIANARVPLITAGDHTAPSTSGRSPYATHAGSGDAAGSSLTQSGWDGC